MQLELTTPYAITVEFVIEPDSEESFMALMLKNAEESLRTEPGCLRFDVLTPCPPQSDRRVFLYEVYKDEAAFGEHLASAHYKKFSAVTNAMVRAKSVSHYSMLTLHQLAAPKAESEM